MPVAPCHACGGEVGASAQVCPHCGASLAGRGPSRSMAARRRRALGTGLAIVGVLSLVLAVQTSRSANQAERRIAASTIALAPDSALNRYLAQTQRGKPRCAVSSTYGSCEHATTTIAASKETSSRDRGLAVFFWILLAVCGAGLIGVIGWEAASRTKRQEVMAGTGP